MEALYESAPQSIVQIGYTLNVYLNKSSDSNVRLDPFILLSLLFSIYSMTSKLLSNDKKIFTNQDGKKTHSMDIIRCMKRKQKCLNAGFIVRVMFRLIDLTSNIFVYITIWYAWNYIYMVVYLSIFVSILSVISMITHEVAYMQFVFTWTIVFDGTDIQNNFLFESLYNRVWILTIVYKMVWIITTLLYNTNSSNSNSNSVFLKVILYGELTYTILSYPLIYFMFRKYHISRKEGQVSLSRTWFEMVENEDWKGIKQLVVFDLPINNDYDLYNNVSKYKKINVNIYNKYYQAFTKVNSHGRSAFHLVCYCIQHGPTLDDIKFISNLPGSIEFINQKDIRSQGTPLMLQCRALTFGIKIDDLNDRLKYLLSLGAIVDTCDVDEKTPLHYVAQLGDIKSLNTLLQHNTNVNQVDKNDRTPLQCCIQLRDDQGDDKQKEIKQTVIKILKHHGAR